MSERQESGKTAEFFVYRAFDGLGALLYAGFTSDLVKRFCYGHRKMSHWVWDVEQVTAEGFADRHAAFHRERLVIFSEGPRWNAAHSSRYHEVVADRKEVDWPTHSLHEHAELARKLRRLTYPIQYGTLPPTPGAERIRSQGRFQ